jgi:hypothetical protein
VTNILTAQQAANVLRCDPTDPEMLDLLPLVDRSIINRTGHDWTKDTPIEPIAQAAAMKMLVMWHEDPGMMAQRNAPLSFGLISDIVQLEALAGQFLEFQGMKGTGACTLMSACVGDTVSTLVGLIGVTGNQASSFETVISVADQIQQISTSDLSANWYRATLTPVGHL